MLSRNNWEGKPKHNLSLQITLVLESRGDSRNGGPLITERTPYLRVPKDKEAKIKKGGIPVWQREISKFSNCSERTAKG